MGGWACAFWLLRVRVCLACLLACMVQASSWGDGCAGRKLMCHASDWEACRLTSLLHGSSVAFHLDERSAGSACGGGRGRGPPES